MNRQRWKPRQPAHMQEAIRLCLDYAVHKHNRSVARIAELMGISEWVIYKWMSKGSIPSERIRPFEFACDATYITQYIAASAQKLIIDIPAGKPCGESDLLDLQNTLNSTVSLLTQFYRGDSDVGDVLQGINAALVNIASHRENVKKHDNPELGLFEEDL